MSKQTTSTITISLILITILGGLWLIVRLQNPITQHFDGQHAFRDVETQVLFGPRTIGSTAHRQTITWILDELKKAGWEASLQEVTWQDKPVQNVIAKRGHDKPWIVLGAHYDSRFYADQDPNPKNRQSPVPGANDGASGVAVLLELARILPNNLNKQIWLVFLDNEDNGQIAGWDWIMGSSAFVDKLTEKPDAAIIVDMIGDADLNIYLEQNSDQQLSAEIWNTAAKLGYKQFISTPKYRVLDDHIPFIQAGIRAVDIIDLDYPYWHTISDTADKVSAQSLEAVGETLRIWLIQSKP